MAGFLYLRPPALPTFSPMTQHVTRPEISGVAGVPETFLSDALVGRLPGNLAPAPWTCVAEAVVWTSRPSAAARDALAPTLRGSRPLLVIGGMVRYEDTPVGTYDEVFGMVLGRDGVAPWGHVAFMAVDSEPSLVGGRTNWAMPKTLASFEGTVGSGRTLTARGADSDWTVSATPRAIGPWLPVRTAATTRQEFPVGRVADSRMRGRGRFRPALVTVSVDSVGPLAAWLRPGRHSGAVVGRSTFSLDEPGLG